MTVYLKYLPDYFTYRPAKEKYFHTLKGLTHHKARSYLCLDDEGLTTGGKVYFLWQKLLSYFGFTNHTDLVKTDYELLKLVFYGIGHKYISQHDELFLKLRRKIANQELRVSEAVRDIFSSVPTVSSEAAIPYWREKIVEFYHGHEKQLVPSFFESLFAKKLQVTSHDEFGETYLKLAKAFPSYLPKQERKEAISELYQSAAAIYNSLDVAYSNHLDSFYEQVSALLDDNGPLLALRGERKYLKNPPDFKGAYWDLYNANYYNAPLTPTQRIYFVDAAIRVENFETAYEHFKLIPVKDLSLKEKELYVECSHQLSMYYSTKKNSVWAQWLSRSTFGYINLPEKYANAEKGLKQKAEITHDDAQTHRQAVIAGALAIELQFLDAQTLLTTSHGQDVLNRFTQAVESGVNSFLAKEELTYYLSLIDQSLKGLGNVEELVEGQIYRKIQWANFLTQVPNDSSKYRDKCPVTYKLCGNIGAKLHFYRGQLLERLKAAEHSILEAYKMAAHYAPNHPFGAVSVSLREEDRPTNLVNETEIPTLREQITVYREIAEQLLFPDNK